MDNKKFVIPEALLVFFSEEDIITGSGPEDVGGGDNEIGGSSYPFGL